VDGNGTPELIVGSGPGRRAEVRIYDVSGKLLATNVLYPAWFKGGIRVAVGDIDGDGKDEIVTAPGPGIEPLIYLLNGDGTHRVAGGKLAYTQSFQGGVRVAMGDMDKDGKDEIVTAPGPGGGPHVRFFDGFLESKGSDFFPFDQSMRDGVSIAVLRSSSGGILAVSPESWTTSTVRLFTDMGRTSLGERAIFEASPRNGVVLAAYDVDGDGFDEIAATQNGGTAPELRIITPAGVQMGTYLVHDPSYRGAISMAQVGMGTSRHLMTIAVSPLVKGPVDTVKSIYVNLSEQRLYAFERGRVARTFLVSTGVGNHPTPEMTTTVLQKVLVKNYRWNYGLNNPDNYDLPNVKWNLQIKGPFFIHYAYWHNNFGNRMSHGCVNVGKVDSEWIYNWAEVGTPVQTAYKVGPAILAQSTP
jgi:hypothetical protein